MGRCAPGQNPDLQNASVKLARDNICFAKRWLGLRERRQRFGSMPSR